MPSLDHSTRDSYRQRTDSDLGISRSVASVLLVAQRWYIPSEAAPQTTKLELNSYSALSSGSAPPAASPIESLNGESRTRNLTCRQRVLNFKDSRLSVGGQHRRPERATVLPAHRLDWGQCHDQPVRRTARTCQFAGGGDSADMIAPGRTLAWVGRQGPHLKCGEGHHPSRAFGCRQAAGCISPSRNLLKKGLERVKGIEPS